MTSRIPLLEASGATEILSKLILQPIIRDKMLIGSTRKRQGANYRTYDRILLDLAFFIAADKRGNQRTIGIL